MTAEVGYLPDILEHHEEGSQYSYSRANTAKTTRFLVEETSSSDDDTQNPFNPQPSVNGIPRPAPTGTRSDSVASHITTINEETEEEAMLREVEYDTDIEIDEEALIKKEEDTHVDVEDYNVGKTQYKKSCSRLQIHADSKVVDNLESETLNLEHQGLGEDGAKALAKSLLKNTRVEKLKLDDNSITPLGITFLSDMMSDNIYIRYLDLSHNDVGALGCIAIQEMLLWNTTLTHLILSECKIKDSDIGNLSEGIQRNEVVVYLDLSHNGICEDGAMLFGNALALNNSIEQLNLSWNHIRRRGAVQICKGLKRNYCCTKVDLSWNGFGYEGALSLGQMLKTNKYIKQLDVSSNRFTWNCASAIANGLKDNNDLEVLKIGLNALTMTGVLEILHAVSNERTELEYLSFEGIPINRKISYIAEKISENREFSISHGGVIDTNDVLGVKKVPQDDPLTRLMGYLNDRGIRPVELFRTFEKGKDNIVTREQFIAGLTKAQVPLETWEMVKVMEALDKEEKGHINYKRLNLSIKEKKINNKLKAESLKRDQKKKLRDERKLLNPELSSSRSNSVKPLTSGGASLRSSQNDLNQISRRASRISLNVSKSFEGRRSSNVSALSLPAVSQKSGSNYRSLSHRNSLASTPNQALSRAVSSHRRTSREDEIASKLRRQSMK